MRIAITSAICSLFGLGLFATLMGPRTALWHVVQACVLDYETFGRPFPCLFVDTSGGRDVGYAVLRAPVDDVKIIVTPTVRTIGIEDPRLRGPGAPNYFADAWTARRYAVEGLAEPPTDDDMALALNSRPGRSQDQLHIHVACLSPEVKRAFDREAPNISAHAWTSMRPLPRAPTYMAHFEPGRDLSKMNVIDLATKGLEARPHDLDGMTIVVAATAAAAGRPAGFTILTRKRARARDEPHGEALLDQDCRLLASP